MNKKPMPKGGRPKGSKNVRTILLEETAAKLGFDPFKTVCLFAMGDWKALGYDAESTTSFTSSGIEFEERIITPELRATCARDACRYLNAPKQSKAEESAAEAFEMIIKDYSKKP